MDGQRDSVLSADGTRIGLRTAGEGPTLLLVHGGMCSSARWAPLWPLLVERFRVTAMDRRGRGASSDGKSYSLEQEYADMAAVVRHLATARSGPVDVFGHSYGAVCALGAAATGAPVRRLVLHEPPGPATVAADWLEQIRHLVAGGQLGHAMASFLVEVVGLSTDEVEQLRGAAAADGELAGGSDPLAIVEQTMVREAEALGVVDLPGLAARVDQPVLLLLGSDSPDWARGNTEQLLAGLSSAAAATLTGQGHEAVDTAPGVVATLLEHHLLGEGPPPRT